MGHDPQNLPVLDGDDGIVRSREPGGVLGDDVQDRLDVGGRLGDDLEDTVAGRFSLEGR
jgi:hypothetical protein